MIKWLNARPWIYVVIAFVVLITNWVVLLNLAAKHGPEKVPLEISTTSHER